MANFSQNFSISGLETLTVVMPLAGAFTLSGKLSLPNARESGIESTVVTTIKQNGSTIFTSTAGALGFSIPILAALSDSFTVQLSSSTAEDAVLNAVTAVVSIG
jgi:hypothetical protein